MFSLIKNFLFKISKIYKVRSDCQINNLGNIYKDLFGYKNNGIFIEVGAYDGESCETTTRSHLEQ